MATQKCPLCESPCIIKIIATDDERWCKVDVCSMCGTMYPAGRKVVQIKQKNAKPKKKTKAKVVKKRKK
jgi:DNA-directed RNA polymerase subunit M/transcription elongation factor TFIIS